MTKQYRTFGTLGSEGPGDGADYGGGGPGYGCVSYHDAPGLEGGALGLRVSLGAAPGWVVQRQGCLFVMVFS